MDVKFVPRTHYMFSVGKDRTVKYWDADKFELLLTLEGHHAEVWCLANSSRGNFIVTGSHDRSIRRWDRTEEQLFIEVFLNSVSLNEVSMLNIFGMPEKRLEETFEADLDKCG
jgi:U3 small nucleolar RNA-associated protein 12